MYFSYLLYSTLVGDKFFEEKLRGKMEWVEGGWQGHSDTYHNNY